MELLFILWHIPCLGRLMDKWRTLRPHGYRESGSPTLWGHHGVDSPSDASRILHDQGLGFKEYDLIGKRQGHSRPVSELLCREAHCFHLDGMFL